MWTTFVAADYQHQTAPTHTRVSCLHETDLKQDTNCVTELIFVVQTLMATSDDELQTMVHQLNITARKYRMTISSTKTK